MAEQLLMLALSPTMEEGTINQWRVKEGDSIAEGDVLCDVETDKATMEYESTSKGTLLKILIQAGSSVLVGEPIAIIGQKDENIDDLVSQLMAEKKQKKEPAAQAEVQATAVQAAAPQPVNRDSSKIKTSPLARKLAQSKQIDLHNVQGSGPGGRIVKRDIEDLLSRGQPVAKAANLDVEIPFTSKRKIIGERLAQSKFTAPHFYLNVAVDFENIIRARQNYGLKHGNKPSINAFIMKMAAQALHKNPDLNVSVTPTGVIKRSSVDIGLAVAQADGLITPVVRGCESKGLLEINEELKVLIDKARNNTLTPPEYTNNTFTISSLGNFGIETFTAIINPPAAAILAVGSMQKKPVVDEKDQIVIKNMVRFSLSCDHRVVDGAVGAVFLKMLKDFIENPIELIF